jgi:hypothetical protein
VHHPVTAGPLAASGANADGAVTGMEVDDAGGVDCVVPEGDVVTGWVATGCVVTGGVGTGNIVTGGGVTGGEDGGITATVAVDVGGGVI